MESWIKRNRPTLEREVLHDFCRVADLLFVQRSRFEATKTLSFPVLRDMVGDPINKGLLWRLKDNAHHIFLHSEEKNPVGVLLDWCIGSIYHETQKLMEDAHQRQFYAFQLADIANTKDIPEVSDLAHALLAIQQGTFASIHHETQTLTALFTASRKLFALYFSECADHRPLARLLYDNKELVQRVFGRDYEPFLRRIYGMARERLYIEAAHSLLEGARFDAAREALFAALAINPNCEECKRICSENGWS